MEKELERFWKKVDIAGLDDCWEWTATKDSDGYGRFRLRGKRTPAHRFAWRIARGMETVPEGLCVCHQCDNPGCVNPAHLFLGTQKENIQDSARKGRMAHGRYPGEKNGQHKLKEGDVRDIRSRYADGVSQYILAREYGVGRTTVGFVVRRETWSWLK